MGPKKKFSFAQCLDDSCALPTASVIETNPNATKISEEFYFKTIDTWTQTPAKHRKSPQDSPLPLIFFASSKDPIWHPEISPKPFSLDYTSGPLGHRLDRAQSDSSPLRKSLPKLKELSNPVIWDLCGGWRVDALLMALWGYSVESLEISPLVHLLTARAYQRSEHAKNTSLKLKFHNANALEELTRLANGQSRLPSPSIVYLDPMYPESTSTALNQSDMRFLDLISDSSDIAESLVQQALKIPSLKIILKRPIHSNVLLKDNLNKSLEFGSTRFDLYIGSLL